MTVRRKAVRAEPVSTFSVDAETGAYAIARRFPTQGQLSARDAVRMELTSCFHCDCPAPDTREAPFPITGEVAVTPLNPATRLLRTGLPGWRVSRIRSRAGQAGLRSRASGANAGG